MYEDPPIMGVESKLRGGTKRGLCGRSHCAGSGDRNGWKGASIGIRKRCLEFEV